MKLGGEDKKKVIALSALGVVAAYLLYTNVLSDSSPTPSAPAPKAASAIDPTAATSPVAPAAQSTQPRPLITNRGSKSDEFHPVFRPKNRTGEQAPNLAEVDPTLHTELLAKVQELKVEGGQRNLFQFGAAEPAPLKGDEPRVAVSRPYIYPQPPPPKAADPGPPPPPPPTPPSFKYYGLATKRIDNKKTAFFLDGEDIILATEGMTIKTRWRLVRINTDSVTLEDTQNKKQQPLQISEDVGGTS
jgi:hypothetical protein